MLHEPVIVERTFNAPVEKLWNAITDKEQMQKWYFNLSAFEATIGFQFEFEGGKDERVYLHQCTVTAVVPHQRLSYTWQYAGYPGRSVVTFELFANGPHTTLRLTHEGLETFPENNPDFARENFDAGWNYIIGTSLQDFIEPKPGNQMT